MTKRRPSSGGTAAAKRAAVYVRVSSAEQVEGTSLDTQRERCRAYAEGAGWTVVGTYSDEGISGAKASRPALDRMLAEVRAGRVDVVVVAKLDRLGRSMRHLAGLLGELDDAGVSLVSVSEAFDSASPSGRLQRSILGSFAEFEREAIRERTWAGKLATARRGLWPGGAPPFGFRVVDRRLVEDPIEAAVVRRAVHLIVHDGLGLPQAAAQLNAEGARTRGGNPFDHAHLRWHLQYGTLDGHWAYAPASGTRRRPGEAQAVLDIPELIPAGERAALARALAATSLGPRPTRRDYILTPIAAPCGGRYRGQALARTVSYRCGGRLAEHPCTCPALPAAETEGRVWAEVVALLSDPARLAHLAGAWRAEHAAAAGVADETVTGIEKRLSRLEQSLATKVADYLRAGVDAASVRAATAEVEAEVAALRAHRGRLVAHQAAQGRTGRAARIAELAETARRRLVDADTGLQRRVLSLLAVRVEVTGWDECSTCGGRRHVANTPAELAEARAAGRRAGGKRCPACSGVGVIARLVIRGEVPEALLAAGALDATDATGATWPWTAEVAG